MGINVKWTNDNMFLFPTGVKWKFTSDEVTQNDLIAWAKELNDYGHYCYTAGAMVGVLVSMGTVYALYKLTHRKPQTIEEAIKENE